MGKILCTDFSLVVCSYSVAVYLLQIFALMIYTVQNAHDLFVEIFCGAPRKYIVLGDA